MFIGLILAVLVAILWSLGEVHYSDLSKKTDRYNVYFYQYLVRSIIYLFVVIILKPLSFTSFSWAHLKVFLPIILCDLFGSYVINIAVSNGKLSVVSPIMAAYPILDVFLGIALLKEKVSIAEFLLVFLITTSIILLATDQKKTKKSPHPVKGIIFALIYMLLIAMSTYLEKTIYIGDFKVFELYYYKGIIYFFTSMYFMVNLKKHNKVKRLSKDIIKGTSITPIGNVLYSFALSFGNIAIVSPISSMYSVLTNYMSRIILKERTTLKENICISIILVSTIVLIIISSIHH